MQNMRLGEYITTPCRMFSVNCYSKMIIADFNPAAQGFQAAATMLAYRTPHARTLPQRGYWYDRKNGEEPSGLTGIFEENCR